MSTQAENIAALGKLIAGIQKHPPPTGGMLAIDGETYTTAEVVQAVQSIIDPLNATVSARGTYLEALKTSATVVSDTHAFVRDLKQSIQLVYGQSPATLTDFGMVPRKITTQTLAEKVARAEKAKATRAARGTKGKKQKAAITGSVTGVTITPVMLPTVAPVAIATTTPVAVAVTAPVTTTPVVSAPVAVGAAGNSGH